MNMILDSDIDRRIPSTESSTVGETVSLDVSEFTIENRIGEGGNAIVYEATVETDVVDRIAVKKITWQRTVTRSEVDEFSTEANTWQRVHSHPNIATVYGFGTDPDPWLATEYLSGGDLSERVPLEDPLEALWIGSAVADAVQHAHHRGTTHLDLKPSNVLLEKTGAGTWDRPKVIDWGLATPLEDRDRPTGLSPSYAPPEQADPDAEHDVGPLADVYQLGALVYALLTGEPPRRVTPTTTAVDTTQIIPPSAVRSSLPEAVDSVVVDALATVPTERTQTAAQFGSCCAQTFRELSITEVSPPNSNESVSSAEAERSTEETAGTDISLRTSPTQSESHSGLSEEITRDTTNGENSEGRQSSSISSNQWFTPRSHPTAPLKSLSQRLRTTGKEPEGSAESIGDALSSISNTRAEKRLGHRLSAVHAESDEAQ